MDPNYVDDEDDADSQAMAAMMGFSGFGSQKPPAKKRKFNAGTDAYVDGQELAKLDKGGKKGQGSGGNTMPLGKTRVFGTAPSKVPAETAGKVDSIQKKVAQKIMDNSDEIDLDDDLDEVEDGPNYIDTSKTPPAEALEVEWPLDKAQPPPVSEEEAQATQARIDDILEGIGGPDSQISLPPNPNLEAPGRSHELPQRPVFGGGATIQGSPGYRPNSWKDSASVASSSRPSHRGEKNPNWFIDYYDANFNENPWAKLEKEKGLEPLCKWPDTTGRRQNP